MLLKEKMNLEKLKIGKVLKNAEFDWMGLTAENYIGKKVLTYLNEYSYLKEIEKNESIVAIITTKEIAGRLEKSNYGILVVENPKKSFFEIHNLLAENNFYYTIEENKISKEAIISPNAYIGENNIVIEENVLIEAGVTIYPNTIIKKGSIVRSGSTIGGNGFHFGRFEDEVIQLHSIGKTILNENVEIKNNSCIDKGVFSDTILEKNVKVDNLIHIGHDVKIGENTFLAACSIVGGRTKIGKNNFIGINSTLRNGLEIGNNVRINMGAVVTKNVYDNESVTGNFAISHDKYLKIFKYLLKKIGD